MEFNTMIHIINWIRAGYFYPSDFERFIILSFRCHNFLGEVLEK